jgi:hypothetical protein
MNYKVFFLTFFLLHGLLYKSSAQAACSSVIDSSNRKVQLTKLNNQEIKLIPANYATFSFGFFCKKEMMVDKWTVRPIRFRLGSLEYCNWLEGKLRYKPFQ